MGEVQFETEFLNCLEERDGRILREPGRAERRVRPGRIAAESTFRFSSVKESASGMRLSKAEQARWVHELLLRENRGCSRLDVEVQFDENTLRRT